MNKCFQLGELDSFKYAFLLKPLKIAIFRAFVEGYSFKKKFLSVWPYKFILGNIAWNLLISSF